MSIETTLFAHIALTKLRGQIEDTAVEALGYIMSNSPAARRALADTLKDGGIEVGPIGRVETWEIGKEGEIPDLVCFDDKGEKQVLIEAKFWADLTKNQPNQYLKQLLEDRQDGPAALLFVAPKAGLDLLWPELCERAKKEFGVTIISEFGAVRSASIENGIHHLQLTSWATLLERMAKESRDDNDSDAEGDIRQLRGLTDRMDGDAFLSLSSEDLASESARQMLDVAELVDDATNVAKEKGFANTDGAKATPWRTGYGRFVSLGGVGTWFGIHFYGWAGHRDTPLWLSFHENNREHLERSDLIEVGVEIDGRICIPIKLPMATRYNDVLNSVVHSLERIAKKFDPSIPATSDGVDSDFFRPWPQEVLDKEFAEKMLGVAQLVDVAARRATSRAAKDTRKWASTDGLKKIIQPRRTGYGRFIRIGGVKAWFGIHFGGWARHRKTPLCLVFDHQEKPRPANTTDTVHEVNWKHCIPIDVPADAENDAVLDSVVDSLKRIAERLDPPDAPRSVEPEQDQNSG